MKDKMEVLSREFFDRGPQRVARQLLGKLLVRRAGRQVLAARVVEAEAYLGEADPAAHAFSGYTERNAVLFGPPGYAYVYLIYGQYYCLNVSCLPEGKAGCVLFRALEPVAGIAAMARNRGGIETESETLLKPSQLKLLTSGPGRPSDAFAITRARDNGKDLASSDSDLYLADDGFRPRKIAVTPRIGLTRAVEWPLRFVVAGNVFVSGPRLRAGKTSGRQARSRNWCRPCGTCSISPFQPGTAVPGYLVPALRGWNAGGFSSVLPGIQASSACVSRARCCQSGAQSLQKRRPPPGTAA